MNPEGLDVQLYVLPATAAAPIVVDDPAHILWLAPVFAGGMVPTVTITLFVAEQPPAVSVSVSVYVVVTAGATVGFDSVEVKPAGLEVQLYVLPVTGAAPITAEAPSHIVILPPVAAAGALLITTSIVDGALVHPPVEEVTE